MSHVPAISPQVFWPYFTAVVFSLLAIFRLARASPPLRNWRMLLPLGSSCIAVPMAVFGADHLSASRDIMQVVPAWMPGRLFWAYFVGACLFAAALSIILKIKLRLASLLLGSMLLLFVLLIHLPNGLAKPGRFHWIYAARDLVFACGALILGTTEHIRGRSANRFVLTMQFVIAAIAVFYGAENLRHPECVPAVPLERLMPTWIPLGPLWTSVSGVALILGGVAMLSARSRQIGAAALGVLVLLLVLFIYVPMMIAKPDVDSLNYVFDTLVFAGTFLVAANAGATPSEVHSDVRFYCPSKPSPPKGELLMNDGEEHP